MNPRNPSQATARLTNGLSNAAPSFGPNLLRREMKANRITNMDEKPRETAINPAEDDGGPVRSVGTLDGKSDRSMVEEVQPTTLFMKRIDNRP